MGCSLRAMPGVPINSSVELLKHAMRTVGALPSASKYLQTTPSARAAGSHQPRGRYGGVEMASLLVAGRLTCTL